MAWCRGQDFFQPLPRRTEDVPQPPVLMSGRDWVCPPHPATSSQPSSLREEPWFVLKEEGGRERKNMNMNRNVCGAEEEKGGKVVPGEHCGPASCRNSVPAAGGLNGRHFVLEAGSVRSWFWQLRFFWALSLQLVDGCLLPVSSRSLYSVRVCVLFLVRTSVILDHSPPCGPHFNFITSLEAPTPNTVTL